MKKNKTKNLQTTCINHLRDIHVACKVKPISLVQISIMSFKKNKTDKEKKKSDIVCITSAEFLNELRWFITTTRAYKIKHFKWK